MKKALTDLCRALVALICFATVAPIQAQSSDSLFTRTEAMILMRDGVRLHTRVFTPSGAAEKQTAFRMVDVVGRGPALRASSP